jgi:hypothetical protein
MRSSPEIFAWPIRSFRCTGGGGLRVLGPEAGASFWSVKGQQGS